MSTPSRKIRRTSLLDTGQSPDSGLQTSLSMLLRQFARIRSDQAGGKSNSAIAVQAVDENGESFTVIVASGALAQPILSASLQAISTADASRNPDDGTAPGGTQPRSNLH